MKVIYEADMTSVSGYSRAARSHSRALIEAGVDVRFLNRPKDDIRTRLDPFWTKELPRRLAPDRTEADIVIWHETPEFYEPDHRQKNVALLAWETSKIPSVDLHGNPRLNWVRQLNRMDEVWVPCTHNQRVLLECGVQVPVHVVPHPIRPEDYPPMETIKPLLQRSGDELVLLSVFQWQPRKDPITLLIGFYSAKTRGRLLLKTYRKNFQEGRSAIVRQIEEVKRSFHVTPASVVVPVLDQVADADMIRLYASADAYVTTSRGEGFCLPAVESAAVGLPVVAPRGTAFEDFLADEEGEEVGFGLNFWQEPVFGMGHIPWYSPDQRWMQVDVDDLAQKIEMLSEKKLRDPGFLEKRGRRTRDLIHRLFRSDRIGDLMRARLEALYHLPSRRRVAAVSEVGAGAS